MVRIHVTRFYSFSLSFLSTFFPVRKASLLRAFLVPRDPQQHARSGWAVWSMFTTVSSHTEGFSDSGIKYSDDWQVGLWIPHTEHSGSWNFRDPFIIQLKAIYNVHALCSAMLTLVSLLLSLSLGPDIMASIIVASCPLIWVIFLSLQFFFSCKGQNLF